MENGSCRSGNPEILNAACLLVNSCNKCKMRKRFIYWIVVGDGWWVHYYCLKAKSHVDSPVMHLCRLSNRKRSLWDHAPHLVDPAQCGKLFADETEWGSVRRSLSNTNNASEPSNERQSSCITTRGTIKWFCSMTRLDPTLPEWSRYS